jgi:hypothetical protein
VNTPPDGLCVAFGVGNGVGIAGPTTCALLDDPGPLVAERLWSSIRRGEGIDALVDDLALRMRTLGSFAVAQLEGGTLRVVVRGTARVVVRSAGGEVSLDASAVKTWSEQVFSECVGFELSLAGEHRSDAGFRAASAIFPASVILWPAGTGAMGAPPNALAPALAAPSSPVPDEPAAFDAVVTEGAVSSDANGMTLHPSRLEDVAAVDVIGDAGVAAVGPVDDVDDVDEYDYDALYGRTVMRTVQGAAVRTGDDLPTPAAIAVPPSGSDLGAPPPSHAAGLELPTRSGLISGVPFPQAGTSAAAPVPDSALGDHDGLTMTAEQLRALRSGTAAGANHPVTSESLTPAMGGPTVQAVMCVAAGHPNPPHASACTRCGAALSPSQQTIARPSMGRIQFSTGVEVDLTRPVIIGRNPKLEGRLHEEMPHTVRIDVGREISRSHAMIRLEGWQVLVEDLGSANGTSVVLPGRPPQRLHPGEPVMLEHGARIDVGGEVWATYDARG